MLGFKNRDSASKHPSTAEVAPPFEGDGPAGAERATFAAGCFWGAEASLRDVEGVGRTSVGYTGGHTPEPSCEQVCSHAPGHAEAGEVWFDPAATSYEALLEVFWKIHNPTTRDRQGFDIGDQYRSVIYLHSEKAGRASCAVTLR